jgi:hypothetical protein
MIILPYCYKINYIENFNLFYCLHDKHREILICQLSFSLFDAGLFDSKGSLLLAIIYRMRLLVCESVRVDSRFVRHFSIQDNYRAECLE